MLSTFTRRGRLVVPAAIFALCAGLLPASVSAASPPSDCATVTPVSSITAGMHGRGWTVAQGQTASPFRASILGVLQDGIAPGRDLIIAKLSDVPGSHMIRDAGVWAGMSGSPVYVNGELIGAVAYSFASGLSPIAGITPAEYMMNILNYSDSASASVDTVSGPNRIALTGSLRATVARAAGISVAQAGTLSRVPTPVAVSGLSDKLRAELQARLTKDGSPVILTAGSSVAAPTSGSPLATPTPGGNFAAMLSYGDVTAGGIGTTTYVCNGQALAFGHPFDTTGPAALGANDADAITIISDPVFGSFKLANIGALFGTVDQDRVTGIRADLGAAPSLIPIISHVTSIDNGTSRTGESDAASLDQVGDIAYVHLANNIFVVDDRDGPGSAWVKWTFTGQRQNGDPWTLQRSNRYVSQLSIAGDASFEMGNQLDQIVHNPFESITVDSVTATAKVQDDVLEYEIVGWAISKNAGAYHSPATVHIQPGDDLSIRVNLREPLGTATTATIALHVPAGASGPGELDVTGGAFQGFFAGATGAAASASGAPATSDPFQRLLNQLANAPKNNSITADLYFFDTTTPNDTLSAINTDRVVDGQVRISVEAPFVGP